MYTILELYKKTGTNKKDAREINEKLSEMNIVLGYFDYVGFSEEITSLDKLLGKRKLSTIDSYLHYELILFDLYIEDIDTKKRKSDFFKSYSKSHIIQITALKIKRELCLYFKYAEQFLYVARHAVEECLKEAELFDKIEFEIWGGLGSYDIVLAMAIKPEQAGACMHNVLKMPHLLRNKIINMGKYQKEIENKFKPPKNNLLTPKIDSLKNTTKHYIFEFSTSFVTISKELDIDRLSKKEKFHAQILCVSHNYIENKDKILSKGKNRKYTINAFYMLGDRDYLFDLKNINLKDLFNLYLRNKTSFLRYKKDGYYTFRSTQTNLCYDEDISSANPPLQNYSQKDATVSIWNNINALYTGYIETNKDTLPHDIKYSFKNILNICHNLLFSDLGYMTGIKTAILLREAYDLIEREGYRPSYEVLTDFAQNISYILPSYFQMDSVLLDNVNTIDGTSPISKLFSSYEQLLKRVYKKINQDNININLFLTVGRTNVINNKLFFRNAGSLEDKTRLVAINLSNLESLSFEHSYPFLLHEIGHYTKFEKLRVKRTATFYYASLLYLVAQIKEKLEKRGNIGIKDPDNFYKYILPVFLGNKFKNLFKSQGRLILKKRLDGCVEVMNNCFNSFIAEIFKPLSISVHKIEEQYFTVEKRREMRKACENLRCNKAVAESFYRCTFDNDAQKKAFWEEVSQSINKYELSPEIYRALLDIYIGQEFITALNRIKKVIHEAQADVVAIKMKNYTFIKFIDKYYPYLKQTGFKIEENEELFMRLAVVLLYLNKNPRSNEFENTKLIIKNRKNLPEYTAQEEAFMNAIFEQAEKSEDFLMPIAMYLGKSMQKLETKSLKNIRELVHGEKDFDPSRVKPCFFISYWLKEMQEILEYDHFNPVASGKPALP